MNGLFNEGKVVNGLGSLGVCTLFRWSAYAVLVPLYSSTYKEYGIGLYLVSFKSTFRAYSTHSTSGLFFVLIVDDLSSLEESTFLWPQNPPVDSSYVGFVRFCITLGSILRLGCILPIEVCTVIGLTPVE